MPAAVRCSALGMRAFAARDHDAHGSEVVLADVLADEFLQPLDGLDLHLPALLPEPLEFGEFVGVLDVLVVPPHGVETLAKVVDHVVVVIPDRLGLANEIVLLNVFFAHNASSFRVKFMGKNRSRITSTLGFYHVSLGDVRRWDEINVAANPHNGMKQTRSRLPRSDSNAFQLLDCFIPILQRIGRLNCEVVAFGHEFLGKSPY